MNTENKNKKNHELHKEYTDIKKKHSLINFPENVKLTYRRFTNWSEEIHAENIPYCIPNSDKDVISVVNWAWKQNYKLRVVGESHNWSPLIIPPKGQNSNRIILIDLTQHFTQISIKHLPQYSIVTAQTGVLMETLTTKMEEQEIGFTATPAPGDLTLGGVLAIGGHGTGIKALHEKPQSGHSYGSLSNSILSLSAVVWDEKNAQYVIKRFKRNDPNCAPLLVHLGCSLILNVELQAGKNQRLRCESIINIPAAELFAPVQDEKNKKTFSHFLDKSGRVEAILFPFTIHPWLKVWSISPEKPLSSVQVTQPYNYPFSDNIPIQLSDLIKKLTHNLPNITPAFGAGQYFIMASYFLTGGADLWGWSKNLLLYVKPTTLRVTANGYAILTRRDNIQKVLNLFYSQWKTLIKEYERNGKYPVNGPIEIRVSGLDTPSEVVQKDAVVPSLSAIRPRPDHPEWDVAIWLDVLTLPGAKYAADFYNRLEQWLFKEFDGSYASIRVEWSKGWAYSKNAAWDDEDILTKKIPASFTDGLPTDTNWYSAVNALKKFDPYGLFRSPLLEKLLSGK
ncbi:cholesterol oxidase substrate-binding domain-containing protein [Xenorhabdus budapestensis]|uniref:FAD-binding protein n=1 Tax=Xenorhabdus budapestensis TaxID=290110 RepID=A0ABX7VI02_XENBU|nr:cholesterol oxidase substrate-binding domain-containing protein [Xenorhabdus budapestensis]QTL39432.1 FAD-binding protein [Xenorhabdus budapestensis]